MLITSLRDEFSVIVASLSERDWAAVPYEDLISGTALLPFAGQRSAALPVVVVECQAHSRSLIDSIDNETFIEVDRS